MFEARIYKNSNEIIHAECVKDENKIFYCLNFECDAEFKLRSHHGVKRQHFYRFSGSMDHIENCIYIDDNNEAFHKNNVDNFNIQDIFNKTILSKDPSTITRIPRKNHSTKSEEQFKTIINSTKSLLKFCRGNSIDTKINEINTINDIYIDYRNIFKYYLGFNGLKLLYGETLNFNKNTKTINFTIRDTNRTIWLNVSINLPDNLYKECISFIYTNNNSKFSGFPIAVLAEWNKLKDYKVEASIISKGQVIYK